MRYCESYFDQNGPGESLGDIWTAVGSIGAAGVGLLPALFGGGGSAAGGPARGLAAINAFGQQAIQTLNQILTQLNNRQLSPADAIANAERITAALSDPRMVYQAQRGDDADALRAFKSQAAAILERIRSVSGISPADPAAVGTPITSGGSTTAVGQAMPDGLSISPTVLLVVGGGLVALLLLKR